MKELLPSSPWHKMSVSVNQFIIDHSYSFHHMEVSLETSFPIASYVLSCSLGLVAYSWVARRYQYCQR